MKKHGKWCIIALLCCMMLGVTGFTLNQAKADTATRDYSPTITSEMQGDTIVLLNDVVAEFAANYTIGSAINYAYPDVINTDRYMPKPATISWENSRDGALYYTLRVGLEKDLSDADSYIVNGTTADIDYLFAAKHYYYQVYAHYENDEVIESRIFDFYTADLPRTVYVEGVTNTRDVGGRYVLDDQYQVKQGMVYRGSEVDRSIGKITEEGRRVMLYDLGIKTDLDLRGEVNNSTNKSPIDDSLNYVHVVAPWYTWIFTASYKEALATEIRTFANPDNYPIYLHCSFGRDRAGTLAYLVSALVGVEETDLCRDYEMTFFSRIGLENADQAAGQHADLMWYFTGMINEIQGRYPAENLMGSVERFAIEYLGITKAEVDSIRNILLEETECSAAEIAAERAIPSHASESGAETVASVINFSEVKATVGAKPMLSLSAAEGNSGVTQVWSDGALDQRNRLTAGEHTCTITATYAGGDTVTKTVNFIVTENQPTYSLIADEADLCGNCTVTFDGKGPVAVTYGFKLLKPVDPTKEATAEATYEFIGWYLGDKEWDFEKDVALEDLNLESKWEATKQVYTVSFDGKGVSQKIEYGSVIPANVIPADPTKGMTSRREFTFAGWYLGDKLWNFETDVVTGDTELTSKFTEKARRYTVTFDGKNAQQYEYGAKIIKPENPAKASTATVRYEFVGWYYLGKEWDFDTDIVNYDIKLQSKWNEVAIGGKDSNDSTQKDRSSGCGGVVNGMAGGMIALGVAVMMLLKKKEN